MSILMARTMGLISATLIIVLVIAVRFSALPVNLSHNPMPTASTIKQKNHPPTIACDRISRAVDIPQATHAA